MKNSYKYNLFHQKKQSEPNRTAFIFFSYSYFKTSIFATLKNITSETLSTTVVIRGKNAKPDINYARSRNNSSTLDYLLKQLEDDEPRWIVNDDVKYKNGSKDYDQINEYIKNNVNSNFNISNYTVNEYEFDFTTSEKITSLFFIYMLGDIRSDFGYEVDFDENGNALLITQIGTDLSTYKPTGEEKTDEDTAAILKNGKR